MKFICMTSEVMWQCDTPSLVGRLKKYSTLSDTLFNTYIFKVIVINLLCSIKICHLPGVVKNRPLCSVVGDYVTCFA